MIATGSLRGRHGKPVSGDLPALGIPCQLGNYSRKQAECCSPPSACPGQQPTGAFSGANMEGLGNWDGAPEAHSGSQITTYGRHLQRLAPTVQAAQSLTSQSPTAPARVSREVWIASVSSHSIQH